MPPTLRPFSFARIVRAIEKVNERLLRATAALEKAAIPYAVTDGNAVAAWVARVDSSAVRNTPNVNLLLRRSDLSRAIDALEEVGFTYRHVGGMDIMLDGPEAKARDAVHIVFAGEKVRPYEALPNPDVTESEPADSYRILTLEALVRVKLTAFRDKDRTHLRDLLDVGLVDETWPNRFPTELALRLQSLIDDPEG